MLTALLTALFTVGFGLLAFEYQQKWNKKLSLYEEIIERLTKISRLVHHIKLEVDDSLSRNDPSLPDDDTLREIDEEVRNINYRKSIYKLMLPRNVTSSINDLTSSITLKSLAVTDRFKETGYAGDEFGFVEEIQDQYGAILAEINLYTQSLIAYVQNDLGIIQKSKNCYEWIKKNIKNFCK